MSRHGRHLGILTAALLLCACEGLPGQDQGSATSPAGVATSREALISGAFSSAAGGYYHTVALKPDGTLWGAGYNANGELGDGTTALRSAFEQVAVP